MAMYPSMVDDKHPELILSILKGVSQATSNDNLTLEYAELLLDSLSLMFYSSHRTLAAALALPVIEAVKMEIRRSKDQTYLDHVAFLSFLAVDVAISEAPTEALAHNIAGIKALLTIGGDMNRIFATLCSGKLKAYCGTVIGYIPLELLTLSCELPLYSSESKQDLEEKALKIDEGFAARKRKCDESWWSDMRVYAKTEASRLMVHRHRSAAKEAIWKAFGLEEWRAEELRERRLEEAVSNPKATASVEKDRTAAEKKVEEYRVAAEKKDEEDRIAADRKVEEDRIAAEKKAEEDRVAADRKVEEHRIAAEKKVEEYRIAAEKKAKEYRIAAEKKAKEDRVAAERKLEEYIAMVERKVEKQRIAAEKKVEEYRIAADRKTEECSIAEKKVEEYRIAADRKAEECRIAERKVLEAYSNTEEYRLVADKKIEEYRIAAKKSAEEAIAAQKEKIALSKEKLFWLGAFILVASVASILGAF